MTDQPWTRISGFVLGSPDPKGLAAFYSKLLGWPIRTADDTWVTLKPPYDGPGLSFQLEDVYDPPEWPARHESQQMMAHLDIQVEDLEVAGEHAKACGAHLAEFQPQDDVRVWLDPAGHPFCLWVVPPGWVEPEAEP
ncbi:MAG TPA: VOC family protein [Acidimicrobiales bacterium]|nr:VOC family protein [Acidimicrobiales bacterium]